MPTRPTSRSGVAGTDAERTPCQLEKPQTAVSGASRFAPVQPSWASDCSVLRSSAMPLMMGCTPLTPTGPLGVLLRAALWAAMSCAKRAPSEISAERTVHNGKRNVTGNR